MGGTAAPAVIKRAAMPKGNLVWLLLSICARGWAGLWRQATPRLLQQHRRAMPLLENRTPLAYDVSGTVVVERG